MKQRIDKLLVDRGIVPSRERAQALILAGRVLANEQKIEKPGSTVDSASVLRLLGEDLRYVSRGGLKLEAALQHWAIDVHHCTCMDVGASTGGFSDCLLQHGAIRIVAVDTGFGQMDLKIRDDPRVRLLERTNARYLKSGDIGEKIDFIAMDVSFISASLVIPAVAESTAGNYQGIVVLVKPQFEVGRERVGKGGIVRDESAQIEAVAKIKSALENTGYTVNDAIDSPILGGEGNREFLLYGTR